MNKIVDLSKSIFQTQRLLLRPWTMEDLEDFYAYARVDGVGEMAGWKHHESLEDTKRILEFFISGKKTLAVEYHGKVIGSLGVDRYNDYEFQELEEWMGREIGFVLAKDYWGQGLMLEAIERILTYLFLEEDLDFVLCSHFQWNKQSKRVQEKAGFRFYKKRITKNKLGDEELTLVNILWKKDFQN